MSDVQDLNSTLHCTKRRTTSVGWALSKQREILFVTCANSKQRPNSIDTPAVGPPTVSAFVFSETNLAQCLQRKRSKLRPAHLWSTESI